MNPGPQLHFFALSAVNSSSELNHADHSPTTTNTDTATHKDGLGKAGHDDGSFGIEP
jgi:hypothetical protein